MTSPAGVGDGQLVDRPGLLSVQRTLDVLPVEGTELALGEEVVLVVSTGSAQAPSLEKGDGGTRSGPGSEGGGA